jgi:hypothetical protein
MADASTVQLSDPHTPKPASLAAFSTAFNDIKNEFHKSRKRWGEHEPEMFSRVQGLTDHELLQNVDLEKDLVQVRTGESSYYTSHFYISSEADCRYGLHLFGKIKLQGIDDGYVHVRLFVTENEVKLHGIHTYEDHERGKYNAIFHEIDPLEWFDS